MPGDKNFEPGPCLHPAALLFGVVFDFLLVMICAILGMARRG